MEHGVAIFGGGCFWCLEAVYQRIRGVVSVVSGYMGGHVPNPSYAAVCEKTTGHAEVVQITFDPTVVSYAQLLEIFFEIHDPTTLNRQGHDVGPQYRSIIFALTDAQMQDAAQAISRLTQEVTAPIVTERVRVHDVMNGPVAHRFFPAEAEHQNYFRDHPWQGYCMMVVAPKVASAEQRFKALIVQ
ncbi:MAG: peptide-methionine (S)-S-oxide reductase MsrA [Burkholderiaceae bacterium]